jgi:hypothetical protein
MSGDDERYYVPTGDELDQTGALTPGAESSKAATRLGSLRRFLRVGRITVSADVAARKHIGVAPPRSQIDTRGEQAGPAMVEDITGDQPARASVLTPESPPQVRPVPEVSEVPDPRRPADAIVPRTIRMDPAVRERRGLGRPRRPPEGR